MRSADRERIEALVETLIGLLDQDDGDADFEAEPDHEEDPAEWGIADAGALYLYEVEASIQRHLAQARAVQMARLPIRYAVGD